MAAFKSRKRQEVEAELERLEGIVARAGGEELPGLAAEATRLHAEVAAQRNQLATAQAELAAASQQVVETRETAILQEVAVYDYRHPLDDAAAYKANLAILKDRIKAAVKDEQAVIGATSWTVNGSEAQGRKMVKDFSKLLLRAYNNEVDNLVRTMKPYKLDSSVVRLGKTRDTIARLGKTMTISVTDYYHQLRVYELELTADYLAMVAEEKERAREERERLREERKAMQEFKREEERLAKERDHRRTVLERLEASGANEDELSSARAALEEVESALTGVLEREANIRAGYVYVISNVGSFGPEMVKVGMTRRLEPMDRVNELGGASVPFRFDVHALIFSDDAVGLEADLHEALADVRVNLVNRRREYFYTTPDRVQQLLIERHGQMLEYTEEPEALEWHQSSTLRRRLPAEPEAALPEPSPAVPSPGQPPAPTRSDPQETLAAEQQMNEAPEVPAKRQQQPSPPPAPPPPAPHTEPPPPSPPPPPPPPGP